MTRVTAEYLRKQINYSDEFIEEVVTTIEQHLKYKAMCGCEETSVDLETSLCLNIAIIFNYEGFKCSVLPLKENKSTLVIKW